MTDQPTADPAETTRPVVLVAGAAGQAPKPAEVWEDVPGRTVVQVVYLGTRRSAYVARRRILGPPAASADGGSPPGSQGADLP